MAQGNCVVEACGRFGRVTRGMCPKHYAKWSKYGDPLAGKQHHSDPVESLAAHSIDEGDCRVWTGSTVGNGYGQMRVNQVGKLAHRVSYEVHVGPIPEGMDIDHTCHNRSCIKPSHLRIVTRKQNLENIVNLSAQNKSGIRGVYWDKRGRKWIAKVGHNYRNHCAGYFDTAAEAEVAVIALRNKLFTHNDRDRRAA